MVDSDALGRRVAKTFAGRTTRWVWDGNLPLHEWQEEMGILLDVEPPPAYAMDARLAEVLQLLRDKTLSPLSPQGPPERPCEQSPITWLFEPDSFAPLARLQGERRESIVCDHLGTPLAMFNDAGDQTWSLDLDIHPGFIRGEGCSAPGSCCRLAWRARRRTLVRCADEIRTSQDAVRARMRCARFR